MTRRTVPAHHRIADTAAERRPRRDSMAASAVGMMAGKAAAMSLGFAFWLAAARVAPVNAVGLAAGATSAIMLVALLATAGLGPATVLHYHRSGSASTTVNAAMTLAGVVGCTVGLAFLAIVGYLFEDLRPIAQDTPFALAFVVMSGMGAVGVVLDHVSMAERRGADVLVRNTANGLITLSTPFLIWIDVIDASAKWLFVGWVFGSASAVIVGLVQIPRALPQHRSRPVLSWPVVRPIVRTSTLNHVLTVAERAPGLVLPLVVTELLSARENAFWYTSWMIAWGASVVPLSSGTALLAELTRDPIGPQGNVRSTVRSSLMIGVPLAAVIAAGAPVLLRLAGGDYAAQGSTPLRLLVLTVVPLSATYPYFALARSSGRLTEAIAAATTTGTIGVVAAAVAGKMSGLSAMAATWLAVQAASGLWAAGRLRRIRLQSKLTGAADGRRDNPADASP